MVLIFTGRCGSPPVHRQPADILPDGPALERRLRRRQSLHPRLRRHDSQAQGHGVRRGTLTRRPIFVQLGHQQGNRTTLQLEMEFIIYCVLCVAVTDISTNIPSSEKQ